MIVVCNNCSKKYNVDEGRVPDQGIKVKCAQCGNIIFIKKQPAKEEAEEKRPPVEEKAESPPQQEGVTTKEPPREETTVPSKEETAAPPKEETAVPPKEEVKEPTPAEETKEKEELRARAKRLARALAKDLILYHEDKVQKGLKEGNLAQLIGNEIRRSWEYYRQQIPVEIIKEHDYFKEALNEIIGKGKAIFK